jgi:hypothetical protein
MATIRPATRADLPAAVELLHAHLPGWPAGDGLLDFLSATLIDHPWADEELPSLVATADDGAIVGFIGSQVRRLRLGDRELRGVCPSHLVVAEESRAGAAGVLLLRRLLTGGQDLTFSDQATNVVTRIWRALGGYVDHARSCDWMLLLRPGRWLGGNTVSAFRGGLTRESVPVAALPFQAAGRRILKRDIPELSPEVTGMDATAAAILEYLPELTRDARLRVAYDESHLEHLFAQIDAFFPSPLVRRVVCRDDQPIGWYAYVLRPGDTSRVLNLTMLENEGDAVLAELVDHARANGSTALAGRLEPHLAWPLRRRLAVMGLARQPVIHTHDLELRALLATSSSLLTQLDSEWFITGDWTVS